MPVYSSPNFDRTVVSKPYNQATPAATHIVRIAAPEKATASMFLAMIFNYKAPSSLALYAMLPSHTARSSPTRRPTMRHVETSASGKLVCSSYEHRLAA